VSDVEEESHESWLQRLLPGEPDLRTAKKNESKESDYLSRTPHVVLYGRNRPAGHCELRRCGKALELCTVLVDHEQRGIGLSHELVRLALQRAHQDPIVAGRAVDDHEPPLVFSFTRSAALAATLTKAGFKMRPPVRNSTRLFIWKSASSNLPLRVQLSLAADRTVRFLRLLFSNRKKAMGQAKHLSEYHLFTRVAGPVENQLPSSEDGVISAYGMDVVRVTEEQFAEATASTQEVDAWDEGE